MKYEQPEDDVEVVKLKAAIKEAEKHSDWYEKRCAPAPKISRVVLLLSRKRYTLSSWFSTREF